MVRISLEKALESIESLDASNMSDKWSKTFVERIKSGRLGYLRGFISLFNKNPEAFLVED